MRPPSTRSSSGRVIVALLGLFFLKALGDLAGGAGHTRGRSAEAFEDVGNDAPSSATTNGATAEEGSTAPKSPVNPKTPIGPRGASTPR